MQETIINVLSDWGYWGVFVLIAIENIFPPIPSEVILTFGGFLTTVTTMKVWGVVLASTFGSVAGAIVLYGAGRLLSAERMEAIVQGPVGRALHLDADDIRAAAERFAKNGRPSVFYCRCIPILRSLISIPAGMAGMPLIPFFTLTTLGSLIWNILLVSLGAGAGKSWPVIASAFSEFSSGVKVLMLLGGVGLLVFALYKRRKKRNNKEDATSAS